jgi:lysine N6-hydroxylase
MSPNPFERAPKQLDSEANFAPYKCIGVGVGPSNLSLAALLSSYRDVRNAFFDRKPTFTWHDGMQFPGANLQVSLFKDLVTLADPTNYFSFISYLHSCGRIYHFLNARFDSISRQEFRNYLKWASESNENVHFGEEVRRIDFDGYFVVETSKRVARAENIVVGIGTEPAVTDFAEELLCESQFHVTEFASKTKSVAHKRIVVVGGGQSGAEAFLELISRDPDRAPREVCWISARENYLPMDDSSFTNEYFMPCHSDYFYEQEADARETFVQRNILASDGVSEATLRQIYQRIYDLRFIQEAPLAIVLMPARTVCQISRDGSYWTLIANHRGGRSRELVHADIVIWATGFRTASTHFLAPLAQRFKREGNEFRIDRDFAVVWDGPADRGIFLLNASRQQRGLPEPNLSLMAWRSQRVIDRIRGTRQAQGAQCPSFVTWPLAPSGPQAERKIV